MLLRNPGFYLGKGGTALVWLPLTRAHAQGPWGQMSVSLATQELWCWRGRGSRSPADPAPSGWLFPPGSQARE